MLTEGNYFFTLFLFWFGVGTLNNLLKDTKAQFRLPY